MTPRLYLDEDVMPELAEVVRAKGYDVVSAHERGALNIDDLQLRGFPGPREGGLLAGRTTGW